MNSCHIKIVEFNFNEFNYSKCWEQQKTTGRGKKIGTFLMKTQKICLNDGKYTRYNEFSVRDIDDFFLGKILMWIPFQKLIGFINFKDGNETKAIQHSNLFFMPQHMVWFDNKPRQMNEKWDKLCLALCRATKYIL